MTATLVLIGYVENDLNAFEQSPRQGDEGAPEAWLRISPEYAEGLTGVMIGQEITILTWLHLAEREVLMVHPRDDPARSRTGVFATRSADRPNPIGLHRASVLEVSGSGLRVHPMEALNGTPILDIKPVLGILSTR